MTFETFVQSDEKTGHDQKQIDKDKYKYKDKDKDKDKSAENLNICYIFEKQKVQGYQI